MARQVFFSFHYERDVWRVSQIRNSWVTRDREAAGFWDAATWEGVKRAGEKAVHDWIDRQLGGTSVTVVLIGAETADRDYVTYEIQASYRRGNGMLGITLHNMKDQYQRTDVPGRNPFQALYVTNNGVKQYLSSMYRTYDWVGDNGYANLAGWIEQAARAAGR